MPDNALAELGNWIVPALYLAVLLALLGVAGIRLRSAAREEGWKLLGLAVLPLPWIAQIALGETHKFGQVHHGPTWAPQAMGSALIANFVLWLVAIAWLWRARRCVVPFVAANVLVMPIATLTGACDWAGACL
jgi:hypothetical protein